MCQEDPFDYSSITKLNMVKKNKNSMIKPGGKIHKKNKFHWWLRNYIDFDFLVLDIITRTLTW